VHTNGARKTTRRRRSEDACVPWEKKLGTVKSRARRRSPASAILVLGLALAAGVVVVAADLRALGVEQAAGGGDGGRTERAGGYRLGEQLLEEAGHRGTLASDGGSHGSLSLLSLPLSLLSLL
jgi:hypothetical protein